MASVPELIALAHAAKQAYQETNADANGVKSHLQGLLVQINGIEQHLKEGIVATGNGVQAVQARIHHLKQANQEARGATGRAFSNSSSGTAGPRINSLHATIDNKINAAQQVLEGMKAELAKLTGALAAIQGARSQAAATSAQADQAMSAAGAQIQAADEAIAKLRSV